MKRGQCPVVLYYLHSGDVEDIATDFVSFYEKHMMPFLEDADR